MVKSNYLLPIEIGMKAFIIDNLKNISLLLSVVLGNIFLFGLYIVTTKSAFIGFCFITILLGLFICFMVKSIRLGKALRLLELKMKEQENVSEMRIKLGTEIIAELEIEIKKRQEEEIKARQIAETKAQEAADIIARLEAEIKNKEEIKFYKKRRIASEEINMILSSDRMLENLIEKGKKGEQDAQFQIYKLFYKSMYYTSLRILNDTMEAEDVMQESFLSAFEKLNTFGGTIAFGSWLKKIVINRSLDALSKRKMSFKNFESVNVDFDSDMMELPSRDVDLRIVEIRDIINRLPDDDRIILSLYLLEGYDLEEISEILSKPNSYIKSLLSVAKQKLTKELREKDETIKIKKVLVEMKGFIFKE